MIYYVNIHTKKHTLKPQGCYRAVEADSNGWIPWHGGECPLPNGAPCDVRDRDGMEWVDTEAITDCAAHDKHWLHGQDDNDIVAYRPACYHQVPEKPQEHDTLTQTSDPLVMLRNATEDTDAALKAIQDALPEGYQVVRDNSVTKIHPAVTEALNEAALRRPTEDMDDPNLMDHYRAKNR